MSNGINYLHSHSGLERNLPQLVKDKSLVLVDEEYKDMFPNPIPFKYKGVTYYRVPIWLFFKRGGVFKNLTE